MIVGQYTENFNENRFNEFCEKDKSSDLQGSHWAPHLIHKIFGIKLVVSVKNLILVMDQIQIFV